MLVAESEPTPAPSPRPRRRRSIQVRVAALLLIPLVSLITLWGYVAEDALDAVLSRQGTSDTYERISLPSITVTGMLAQERTLTAVYVATDGARGRTDLDAQRGRTDAAVAAFREATRDGAGDDDPGPRARERLTELSGTLDGLAALRSAVDADRMDTLEAIEAYGEQVEAALWMYGGQGVDDLELYQQGRGLIATGWAHEFMLREDALITSVHASGGRLTAAERIALAQWAANREQQFDTALSYLEGPPLDTLQEYFRQPAYQGFLAVERTIVSSRSTRLPGDAAAWSRTGPVALSTLIKATTEAGARLEGDSEKVGDRIMRRLVLAGGLGLLAVVASVVLSVLFGRSLIRELRGLRRAADELADDRLPDVVGRLRRGEDVDVAAAAAPLETGRTEEIAHVAASFSKVQRTAIETAVSEAHLRKGVARVFLNLAWRSQSLLHRQLRMLDAMERRVSDPDVLEDLFRIDHLTTRMRRHAEGLIILSGAAPGRGWSRPVPLEDVLRSAAAEVEDFTRVEVVTGGSAALAGAAVADIVHLLAELVENATVFSPPPTEVLVRGELVANGYAIEVIDRGIGIDPRERADLNQRLAEPPEFDLADTDRLGLFVVARLAARQGVKVSLQESVYGGVCAVVLLPPDLVSDAAALPPAASAAPPALDGALGGLPASAAPDPFDSPDEAAGAAGRIEVPAATRSWFEPPANGASPAPSAERADLAQAPAAGRPAPLPRRIRQANLVPELRRGGRTAEPAEPAGRSEPAGPDEAPDRSAEQSRDLLASLQGGWLRGRDDDEDGPADGAADGGGS